MQHRLRMSKIVAIDISDVASCNDRTVVELSSRLCDISRPNNNIGIYIELSRDDLLFYFAEIINSYLLWNDEIYELSSIFFEDINQFFKIKHIDRLDIDADIEYLLDKGCVEAVSNLSFDREDDTDCPHQTTNEEVS